MLQFHFFRRIDLLVKTIAPSGKRPDNMPNRPLFSIFIYLSTFSGGNQVPKETNVPECNPIQKKTYLSAKNGENVSRITKSECRPAFGFWHGIGIWR